MQFGSWDDDVRDVPLDEDVTRREADDLVRRNAAVGAADPEIARRLDLAEPLEKERIAPQPALGPRSVPLEKLGKVFHRAGSLESAF